MLKIEPNKIKLSWDDVETVVDKLCHFIPRDVSIVDSVHGISRGGLVPATLVSHRTGLPYVDVIGPNTLVIDDIADSGKTLEEYPGAWKGVLYYKVKTSSFTPNIWGELHEGEEWLIFPWEKYNSPSIQDYLNKEKNG